jgi:multiple sugar transport system substrate-binding protein
MPVASYTSTKFTAGEIVMTIGSTGGTTYNDSKNFEVGIAPLPYVDSNHKEIISQGPSICFLRRVTKAQKEAAWKFYKFITESTNSAYYAMDTGYDPVRLSSYTCDYYLERMEEDNIITDVFKVTSTLQDRYFSSPSFVGSANARTQVGGIISTYFTGAKTLEEAFQEAYNNCVPAGSK